MGNAAGLGKEMEAGAEATGLMSRQPSMAGNYCSRFRTH